MKILVSFIQSRQDAMLTNSTGNTDQILKFLCLLTRKIICRGDRLRRFLIIDISFIQSRLDAMLTNSTGYADGILKFLYLLTQPDDLPIDVLI